MDTQVLPNLGLVTRTKPQTELKPESVETAHFQEQFTGPVPLRNERPAAEVLAEVGTGLAASVFIP